MAAVPSFSVLTSPGVRLDIHSPLLYIDRQKHIHTPYTLASRPIHDTLPSSTLTSPPLRSPNLSPSLPPRHPCPVADPLSPPYPSSKSYRTHLTFKMMTHYYDHNNTQSMDATQPLIEGDHPGQFAFNKVLPWGRLFYLKANLRLDLTNPEYFIGRARTCDIVMESPECSKRHCRIYTVRDQTGENVLCMVEDLSTNGTYVNGKRLEKGKPVVLSHGDEVEIKVGNFFVYHDFTQESQENVHIDDEQHVVENEYHISKTLGSGTYAEVKLAIHKKTGQRYAVKIIDKKKAGIKTQTKGDADVGLVQEIKIMKDINHPNIVKIHDVIQTQKYLYIFLYLVNGGELFEYLAEHGQIPEDQCKFWFFQVLKAVKYLHDRNITHRDIKPENILLENRAPFSKVLLSDFGLAKVTHNQTMMKTMCGTYNYLAPEVVNQEQAVKGYSKAVDCWSLGVMLYFLLSGTLPFDGRDDEELRREILGGEVYFNEDWAHISPAAMNLIQGFLTRDPQKRITVDQAFKHPWISNDITALNALYERVVQFQPLRNHQPHVTNNSTHSPMHDIQRLNGPQKRNMNGMSPLSPGLDDLQRTDPMEQDEPSPGQQRWKRARSMLRFGFRAVLCI
ncbi:kinase-like domain-containing protein [Paraphysoderma sedebokerense]|nr:kinase-like domain-containing protein [Paraphysoderma sedebokerense]